MTKEEFKTKWIDDSFYWVNEDNYLKLQDILQEFGVKCHVGGRGLINWHDGFKNIVTFKPGKWHDFEYYQKTDFWHKDSRYGDPKDYDLMLKDYSEVNSE
jgi:hypothetical protein